MCKKRWGGRLGCRSLALLLNHSFYNALQKFMRCYSNNYTFIDTSWILLMDEATTLNRVGIRETKENEEKNRVKSPGEDLLDKMLISIIESSPLIAVASFQFYRLINT